MFKPLVFFALLLLSISSLNARTSTAAFFEGTDDLLMRYVNQGRVDYASLKASGALDPLIKEIAEVDLATLRGNERKAFLINAYNLLVIKEALAHYPLQSVLDVNGFFDGRKQQVGGRTVTLNQLEKEILLKQFPDARLHFVLVCGALGCPPITSFAYQPESLESQLNRQTRKALNDEKFIRVGNGGQSVALSQIFHWYAKDFGGSRAAVLGFINTYRSQPLATDAKVTYYAYDWSLNTPTGRVDATTEEVEASGGSAPPTGGGNNAARYVVSAAIPKGTFEIKIFNNLYSQEAAGERASFFTTWTSALFGLTDRINVGFDLRYRRVRYDEEGTARNFDVFRSDGAGAFRQGVTGVGPKVRIAPFNQLPNFSVQSALWLPVTDDPSGAALGQRFIDFDGPTWFSQIFNDFPVGDNFSIFAEVDVLIEDIGAEQEGHINRFSTPITGIVSYFPNPKTTLYGLASYSPYWQENFDYFYQIGGGAKYQFTPKFELEVLLTAFDNQFISSVDGTAGTVNLGLRFNL
jgi:hypothetical protein